jgi:hypothetical protein
MSDRFAALRVKPIPKKSRKIAIRKPKPQGAVAVDVKIVDKTGVENRDELMSKIKGIMVTKLKQPDLTSVAPSISQKVTVPEEKTVKDDNIIESAEEIKENENPDDTEVVDDTEVTDDDKTVTEEEKQTSETTSLKIKPAAKGPTSVKIRIKKPGTKIKLGRTIRKGTITALKPPTLSEKPKLKLKMKTIAKLQPIQSRTRSDVPSDSIIIGDTILNKRLPLTLLIVCLNPIEKH